MIGHLLHVGYPKSGSTSLQRWFEVHPQLAYRGGALAGYRDVYEMARDAVAPTDGVLFRVTSAEVLTTPHRDAGRDTVACDPLVDMPLAQEKVCTSLAGLFPNAHVLIVTRGFCSMILSSFSQYLRSGGDRAFEDLVRTPGIEHPWDYDRLIAAYRNAFGTDRLLVMPYELLRDDADRFVRTIEERLGLAHCAISPERLNTSLSPMEMYWYPRLTHAVCRLPIGARLRGLYLRGVFGNRFRHVITVLHRVRPGTPVSIDSIPDRFMDAYRGKARTLRDNPLYAPYAADYLVEYQ